MGDARVFAVGTGAFLASGAAEGIGGFLQFGVGGDQGEGVDGAVFEMAFHLEAVGQQRLHHVGQEVEVELGFAVGADGLGFGTGLGEEVPVVLAEPFGRVDDEVVVIPIEVPGVSDEDLQCEAGCGDLVGGETGVRMGVGLAGGEDSDVELGGRRGRQGFFQAGGVGGGCLVDFIDDDDGQRGGLCFQLEAELLVHRVEDGDAIAAGSLEVAARGPLDVEGP